MPPPQQLLSSAVSSITKRFNATFLVLVVFFIVALPLSTPSASTNQSQQNFRQSSSSSQQHQQHQQQQQYSSSSNNTSQKQQKEEKEQQRQQKWTHWSANLGEICPAAKPWTTHPGSFCVTLWNSPYLTNRTELEIREGRAIQFFCEMDSILERFDCTQEYSVNVQKRQCKLCRDAYREWACAMVTDTLEDGQLDCETKLMPCPSCASICHQVMRLCPYLSPDRNQWDREGKLAPHVSQYGGHPAFYCPLENDDPSDPAYTSLCFHRSPLSDPDDVHNICTDPPIHHHKDYYAQQTYNHDNHHQQQQNHHHHHPHSEKSNHQQQQYVSSHPGRNNKKSYYSSGPARDFNSPNKKRFNRNPKPIISSDTSSYISSSSSYSSSTTSSTTTTSSSGNVKRGATAGNERWRNSKKDSLGHSENKQDDNKLNNNNNNSPNNNNQHDDNSNFNNDYYDDDDDDSPIPRPEALPRKSRKNNVNYFNTKIDYEEGDGITYGDANTYNSNNDKYINFNDGEDDDGDEDHWSDFIPHYTSCCWTYASSVVHFSKSQAFPKYGSDEYFDSEYRKPGISDSSSFVPRLTSSTTTASSTTISGTDTSGGSGSHRTTSTTTNIATSSKVNRMPSSSIEKSDNRVILNCCDSRGVCTSKDPFEVEEDLEAGSGESEKPDEFGSSSHADSTANIGQNSQSDLNTSPISDKPQTYKTSRKRSSESNTSSSSISSSKNHQYFHHLQHEDEGDDDESLNRDNKKSTNTAASSTNNVYVNTNNFKEIPVKRVDANGGGDDVNIIDISDQVKQALEPLSLVPGTEDVISKVVIPNNHNGIVNDEQSSKDHHNHHHSSLDTMNDDGEKGGRRQQMLQINNIKNQDVLEDGDGDVSDGDDSLIVPKPTLITPGLDYDDHYMDTEPDGDGGSSSTELEDDYNVFENTNGFETRTRTLPVIDNVVGGVTEGGESIRSNSKSSKGPSGSNNVINTRQQNNAMDEFKGEDSIEFAKDLSDDISRSGGGGNHHRMTMINTNNNNNKHNKHKISNNKLGNNYDEDRSISSSVHYPKNAFMAIVIGGDDVDRHHLDLRTGGGGGGGIHRSRSSADENNLPSEIDNNDNKNYLNFKSSRLEESFEPFDFSDDVEGTNHEEIYYGRTKTEEFIIQDGQLSSSLSSSSFVQLPSTAQEAAKSSASPSLRSPINLLIILFFPPVVEPFNSKASTTFTLNLKSLRTDLTECFHFLLILILILITTANVLPFLLLNLDDELSNSSSNEDKTRPVKRVKVLKTFTNSYSSSECEEMSKSQKEIQSKSNPCFSFKCQIGTKKAVLIEKSDEDNQKRFYDDIRKPNYNYYYYNYYYSNCKIKGVPVLKTFHYCNSTTTKTTTATIHSDTHSKATTNRRSRGGSNCHYYYDDIDNDESYCNKYYYYNYKKNYTNTDKTGRPIFFKLKNSDEKTSKILRNYHADGYLYYYRSMTFFCTGTDSSSSSPSSSSSSNRLLGNANKLVYKYYYYYYFYKTNNNNILYYKVMKFLILNSTLCNCSSSRSNNHLTKSITTNNVIINIIITSLALMSIKHKKGESNEAFFNLQTRNVSISHLVCKVKATNFIEYYENVYENGEDCFDDYYYYYDESNCGNNDDTNDTSTTTTKAKATSTETDTSIRDCNRHHHKKMFRLKQQLQLLLVPPPLLLLQVFLANYSYSGFPLIELSSTKRMTKNKNSENKISRLNTKKGDPNNNYCESSTTDLFTLRSQVLLSCALLLLLLPRESSKFSDSRVTKIIIRSGSRKNKIKTYYYCTTKSNTNTINIMKKRCYNYSSRILILLIPLLLLLLDRDIDTVMIIRIINKIIKFVVQYSKDDTDDEDYYEFYNRDNSERTDTDIKFHKNLFRFYEIFSELKSVVGTLERKNVIKLPSKSNRKLLDELTINFFLLTTTISNNENEKINMLLLLQSKNVKSIKFILTETQDCRRNYLNLQKVIFRKFIINFYCCCLSQNYILINENAITNLCQCTSNKCHKCLYLSHYLQHFSSLYFLNMPMPKSIHIEFSSFLVLIIKAILLKSKGDFTSGSYCNDGSNSCDLLRKNDIFIMINPRIRLHCKKVKPCKFCIYYCNSYYTYYYYYYYYNYYNRCKSLKLYYYYYKNCYNESSATETVTFDFEQGGHFLQGQSRTLRLPYSLKLKLKLTRRANRFSIISSTIITMLNIVTNNKIIVTNNTTNNINNNNTIILMIIDNNSEDFIVRRKKPSILALGLRVRIIIIIIMIVVVILQKNNYNHDQDIGYDIEDGMCSLAGSGSLIISNNQLTAIITTTTLLSNSNRSCNKTINKVLLLLIMYSYSMPYYCYKYNHYSFYYFYSFFWNDLAKEIHYFTCLHPRRSPHLRQIINEILLVLGESPVAFLLFMSIST